MLKGLCDAEFKETCLFFRPKESTQKREIKAILYRQLSLVRHELKTMYVNSFEIIQNSKRVNKMWETKNIKKIVLKGQKMLRVS